MTTDFETAPPPDVDILCPLCEYNLRGLAIARCPECGASFDWADLRDPARRTHPFLFEHHPERNVSSFLQTFFAGLRPRKFSKSLQPSQPSRGKRLVLYWVICVLLGSVGLIAQLTASGFELYYDNLASRKSQQYMLQAKASAAYAPYQTSIIQYYGSIQSYLDVRYPLPPSARFFKELFSYPFNRRGSPDWWMRSFLQCVFLFAWPLAVVGILMLLRSTMRSAGVRRIHLFRVAIYCNDIVVWFGLCFLIPIILSFVGGQFIAVETTFWLFVGLDLIQTYRLTFAVSRYLRFRHALDVALAVQIIFVLALLQVCVMITH